MGRRLSATLGFAVGLGAASLLNLDFYSAIAQRAIAFINSPINPNATAPATNTQNTSTPVTNTRTTSTPVTNTRTTAVQSFTPVTSCATNGSHPIVNLGKAHPKNISLLKHVPAFPQRLNWYGITQESAIANAPKPSAPPPVVTSWNPSQAGTSSTVQPCQAPVPSLAQTHRVPLQQQTHFILSLGSLKQKNDWLLQPQPQPIQPIHTVWRGKEPMEIKLASQPQ